MLGRVLINFGKGSSLNVRFAPKATDNRLGTTSLRADSVAIRFWAPERRKLFPDQGRIGNFDSKIHPFGF